VVAKEEVNAGREVKELSGEYRETFLSMKVKSRKLGLTRSLTDLLLLFFHLPAGGEFTELQGRGAGTKELEPVLPF